MLISVEGQNVTQNSVDTYCTSIFYLMWSCLGAARIKEMADIGQGYDVCTTCSMFDQHHLSAGPGTPDV